MTEHRHATIKAALSLGLVGLIGLGGLLGLRALTAERIAAQERAVALQALNVLLPPGGFDNDPVADRIDVIAPAWLGSEATLTVRRARLGETWSALIVEAIAPDGYNGDIRLLVGVDAMGRVLGARVLAHQETPGLGDGIDAARGPWIDTFRERGIGDPPLDAWRVRADGGAFDQLAGATITPRAVVHAVRRVLQLVGTHGDDLADAPTDATLRFDDGPEELP
jgi:electron transport complex protein RnfG